MQGRKRSGIIVSVFAAGLGITTLWSVGAGRLRNGDGGAVETARVGAGPRTVAPLLYDVPPETPVAPPATAGLPPQAESARGVVTLGPYVSVQVNVNALQNNIVGDAANEPSIAVNPANPNQIVIAWRQFDTISSNFRQAGIGYSHDRGQTWTKFTLDPGQFRSDPVLGADAAGRFYFSSLSSATSAEVWRSLDGGVNWTSASAFGGDKQWIAVDERAAGTGAGHIYQIWNTQFSCCPPADFTRSINNGVSFQSPVALPLPSMKWGTLDTGADGTLYLGGATLDTSGHLFTKSTNAKNPAVTPTFDPIRAVNLGGQTVGGGINPAGLLGQVWIAVDNSTGATAGNVYIAGTVNNPSDANVTNVRFIRSVDGGQTWSQPILVNDDPASGAWHWFGTMAVASNGRIDMIWNDTRNDPGNFLTEVYYSYSNDAGRTWAANVALTPAWDPSLGYPQQNKIGDYYHMVSDNGGANLAYAATFNGEEDVYSLRIPRDCNNNGIEDDCDIACGATGTRCDVIGCGTLADCNGNVIPDVCEPNVDCNNNTIPDICDIGSGTSNDCNLNQIPDECESGLDCNNNGIPDICDLANGTSRDCNNNGVPDECDIASLTSQDVNNNGVPDECEGACCTCGSCADLLPFECQSFGGSFSGLGVLCGETGSCTPPTVPSHDACAQASVLPSVVSIREPFDNRCASLDGPADVLCPASQPFGADLWYNYVAPCTGSATVNLCYMTNFDSIMDVYGGGAVCPCPTTSAGVITCGDDTCGIGGGPSQVTFNVTAGACYTIRLAGWSDSTGTGILDVYTTCITVPRTPQVDPSGIDKSRFISMVIPGHQSPAYNNVAIRVTLLSLHHVDPPYTGGPSVPFTVFEGQVRWVGPPAQYVENTSNPTTFYASFLQCAPHYQEWNTLGVLHVTGSAIVPSSVYAVQTLAASCQGNESSCTIVSGTLQLRTTRWGDIETPYNPPDPSAQPDFADNSALVDKFKSAFGAPIKARALLAGDGQGLIGIAPDVGFTHISGCLDAFKGLAYPYTIASCP